MMTSRRFIKKLKITYAAFNRNSKNVLPSVASNTFLAEFFHKNMKKKPLDA